MQYHSVRQVGDLPNGTPVHEITITSPQGNSFSVSEFGARLTSVRVLNRENNPVEIIIGYGDLATYRDDTQYIGCIVGPYANRISKGGFSVDNLWHPIDKNHGELHIHGGSAGFHDKLWSLEPYSGDGYQGISCHYRSPKGTYPANIEVTYAVELRDTGALSFDFHAICDAPCPLNLTNHAYWNLASGGGIHEHELFLPSDRRIEVDERSVPTGGIIHVEHTPYDFRKTQPIGAALEALAAQQSAGIDTCYVLHQRKTRVAQLVDAAKVYSRKTGICMRVGTSFPGIQVYTANNMEGIPLRNGRPGNKHNSLCLETQYFPDSVHNDNFPNTIVRPEEQFHERTIHQFSIVD